MRNIAIFTFFIGIFLFISGCEQSGNNNRGYVISQSQVENEQEDLP